MLFFTVVHLPGIQKSLFYWKRTHHFSKKRSFAAKIGNIYCHFYPVSFFFFSIFEYFWLSLAHWWHFARIETEIEYSVAFCNAQFFIFFHKFIDRGTFFLLSTMCHCHWPLFCQKVSKQILLLLEPPKFLRIYVKNSHINQCDTWKYLTIGWHFFDPIFVLIIINFGGV